MNCRIVNRIGKPCESTILGRFWAVDSNGFRVLSVVPVTSKTQFLLFFPPEFGLNEYRMLYERLFFLPFHLVKDYFFKKMLVLGGKYGRRLKLPSY